MTQETKDISVLNRPPFWLKLIVFAWPLIWGGLGVYVSHYLNCLGLQRPFFGLFCIAMLVVPVVCLLSSSSWFKRRAPVVAVFWTLYFMAISQTCGLIAWFYDHLFSLSAE
jgi:hypothetical protein